MDTRGTQEPAPTRHTEHSTAYKKEGDRVSYTPQAQSIRSKSGNITPHITPGPRSVRLLLLQGILKLHVPFLCLSGVQKILNNEVPIIVTGTVFLKYNSELHTEDRVVAL